MIEGISAITLATHDMARAVRFYRALGFEIIYGGDAAGFTSFRAGRGYLNLIAQSPETQWSWWGRVIFYHSDVDALHAAIVKAGYCPQHGSPRCRMGRAILPHHGSRWTRAQFCLAIAVIARPAAIWTQSE